MSMKLIFLFLLIMSMNFLCHTQSDYSSYDDNYDEEILDSTPSSQSTTTFSSLLREADENFEENSSENSIDGIDQLDKMSNTFRKIVKNLKTKHKKIEMIFLIDASSSIGKENFDNEISFVKRLLSDFNVSFNYTRVALITFSSKSKIFVHVNQISAASKDNDKCVLLNHQIPNITYSGGGTNTFSALLKAKEIFDSSKRKSSKKVLILITDGFSNGKSPISLAQELKLNGVIIFTVGISSGNYDELKSISSKPSESYNYMLSSFSLFEKLVRKALHTDYKVGIILPVSNDMFCDSLCSTAEFNSLNSSCCDTNAQCACGFHSGHYSCICKPGYYGTGLAPDGCEVCPNGTYWNFWNSCFNCPDINHKTIKSPALSIDDCVCKTGFKETDKHRCEMTKCPLLPVPDNGYFVQGSACLNIVNTACGARCNSGYQLIGSSIRLCQEDSTWSGDETECVLKTCPSLLIPFFGMALCKNADLNLTIDYSPRNESFIRDYNPDVQVQMENFPIDTECEFSCAYGYHLVGSPKRHCLPLSKWDGLQASCKQILCQPLPKITHGSYSSEDCTESKSLYGSICTVTCDDGYEVKGPSVKTCQGTRNGAWTQKNKIPRCVDVTPPLIECPDDYKIEISGNNSFVKLSEVHPLKNISDNSGNEVNFWLKPALKESGTNLVVGEYRFTYVAVDDHKNKAKCNFTISVVDVTPPIFENCEQNQTIFILNENQTVEWDEPFGYDNVDDKNITITKNLYFGPIKPGEYNVNYKAIDKSGNEVKCDIKLTVKEKKCEELAKPENGQRVCFKNETHSWCDFRCNFGFGMYQNDIFIENLITICDKNITIWIPESIPECSLIEQPNSVEEIMTISLDTEQMACDDLEENREKIIEDMKEEFCGNEDCELITDLPDCDENIVNVPNVSNDLYYSIISKRDTESKLVTKKKNEKVEIYVKISKSLGLWKKTSTKSDNIKKVKEELKKLNSSESKLKKKLKNLNIDLTVLKLDEKISCNPGSVAKKLVCVQCNSGYYHDKIKNDCIACPIGTFSNLDGQTECNKCPENYSTRKIGSRMRSDCREMCPPGSFARIKTPKNQAIAANGTLLKTLMPFCRTCNVGEYQPNYDQINCLTCPENYTSPRGSKSINDCYKQIEDSCDEKTCGKNGKCIPSGIFYHCECNIGFYGKKCEKKDNPCLLTPCFNNGTCEAYNSTDVKCACPIGYVGDFCELLDEPCSLKNCQNGAQCTEIGSDAFCECLPGFEGDLCEQRIQQDFCASLPCDSDGTIECVNKYDDYECICGESRIGKRCHLTPCDYKPCPGISICVNYQVKQATKESFYCKCPIGLKGVKCDEIDNPCDRNPCKSNAKCKPKILRDPKNITIVEDESIFDKFECECPPFFYGQRCEKFTTPDFVLDFEKSSINNYVKLQGPIIDLTEISFCSWIQTNDHFNYGSLISYANQENDNAFTFTDYNGFVLYVNGENVISDIKIIDDIWHFVCATWSMIDGKYEIYLDGSLHTEGKNLSLSKPIKSKGVMIIGQEQDNVGGGFSESESFVGKISFLDFWNRKISAIEINEFFRTCDPYTGNLYSWTDLKFKIVGDVKISQSEFCKPCEQNLLIDNGIVIYGDHTGFVKCDEGFKILGNPFIYCLRTSKWETSKLPICKIVKCDPLKTPLNGRMTMTKTTYRGQAKFTCDDGFYIEGNSTLSCLSSGKWSNNVPKCKSYNECEALNEPKSGKLIYASDSGIIKEILTSYSVGSYAEIHCNEGFEYNGENLISCTESGNWDFEVEDCQAVKVEKMSSDFLRQFREFLFESCDLSIKSKLCEKYKSSFNTSLSLFELPESEEYEGMDRKLLALIEGLKQEEKESINVGNFLQILIKNEEKNIQMRDSFRFVICLYVDLVIVDEEFEMINDENNSIETIHDKIKKALKQLINFVYENSKL